MNAPRIALILSVSLILGACSAIRPALKNILPTPTTAAAPSPATPVATQAETLTPRNQELLYLNLIEGLEKQQRYGAALAFLDSYGKAESNITPRYWLLRGNALLGLARNAEAGAAYRKMDGTPLSAEGANGQGRVAAAQQEWSVAAANFRKAVQSKPADPDFLNNLAFAEMHFDQVGISAAYLRQAHELAPNSALIRNNLMIALTLSGDPAGAEAILQTIKDNAGRQEARAVVKSAIESRSLTEDGKS
jgi:Flp pilus assembly protein TadD